MKKVITLVMILVLLTSLTSCIVRNEPANTEPKSQAAPKEDAAEAASSDIYIKTMDKAKALDNCYYELVAELNGNINKVTKVWVKGNKTKIQRNDSDVISYIDFEKSEFVDYDSKSKKSSTVSANQDYIDDFNLYAGAYLANADYEGAIGALDEGKKEVIEGNSCIVGSYQDSTSKAKIYISEQYGIVMRFEFSTGNNNSLFYVTNLKIGSVTDQDIQLP